MHLITNKKLREILNLVYQYKCMCNYTLLTLDSKMKPNTYMKKTVYLAWWNYKNIMYAKTYLLQIKMYFKILDDFHISICNFCFKIHNISKSMNTIVVSERCINCVTPASRPSCPLWATVCFSTNLFSFSMSENKTKCWLY